jgi:O-antigen ligase
MYAWAYWPLTVLCAASGVAGLCAARGVEPPDDGARLGVALALVAAAALLQVFPLPTGVLNASNPHRLELLNQLDVGFVVGSVRLRGLSLDPRATIRGVILYVAFALLMLGLARDLSARSALKLLWVITCIGGVLALTGIVQRSLAAGAIYGVWTPPAAERPFGPFVNKNHFAGWMLMAIPLALGYFGAIVSRGAATVRPTVRDWFLWIASREANHAVQAVFAVVVMALALALTLSRSGMLSLALAVLFWGYAAVRRERGILGRSAIIGGLACFLILVVVWAGADTIAARFAAPDTTAFSGRIPIWQGALSILEDFWLTGSGLNSYGRTARFYPTILPGHHLREAHNDYLQLAVEGGLLLGIPIAIAVVTFVVMVRRRLMASTAETYWIRLGAVAGRRSPFNRSLSSVFRYRATPRYSRRCAESHSLRIARRKSTRPPVPARFPPAKCSKRVNRIEMDGGASLRPRHPTIFDCRAHS